MGNAGGWNPGQENIAKCWFIQHLLRIKHILPVLLSTHCTRPVFSLCGPLTAQLQGRLSFHWSQQQIFQSRLGGSESTTLSFRWADDFPPCLNKDRHRGSDERERAPGETFFTLVLLVLRDWRETNKHSLHWWILKINKMFRTCFEKFYFIKHEHLIFLYFFTWKQRGKPQTYRYHSIVLVTAVLVLCGLNQSEFDTPGPHGSAHFTVVPSSTAMSNVSGDKV